MKVTESAFEELPVLMEKAAQSFKRAKRKALWRMKGLISVSYLIGGVGVAMLTLQAYDLLVPLLQLLGVRQLQGSDAGYVNSMASIATVLTLVGISLAAWVRNRGYLTQFLRYALAASEMEILTTTFKLELSLTESDADRAKLARETISKFAEIVRSERAAFAVNANHDLDRIINLVERANESASRIPGK